MSEPDYTDYSLEDLVDARGNIDAEAYPERAAHLDALIRSRQDRTGSEPRPIAPPAPAEEVRHIVISLPVPSPKAYRIAVSCTLAILLLINIATLARGILLAMLPISLQALALTLLVFHPKASVLVVRIWSGLTFLSGLAYCISVLLLAMGAAASPEESHRLDEQLTSAKIILGVARLVGGYWIFRHAPQAAKTEPVG